MGRRAQPDMPDVELLSPAGAGVPGSPAPLSPAVDVVDVDSHPAPGKSNPVVALGTAGQGLGLEPRVGSGRGAGGNPMGLNNCSTNY